MDVCFIISFYLDCMQAKYLLWAIFALTAAVSVLYLTSAPMPELESHSELDLACGFTDDFNKFLKENGIAAFS